MRALAIAATGMGAQQMRLDVIANNIANINTTGFKQARAEFSDLLYQSERLQGVAGLDGDSVVPEGANIGLGVRPAAVRNLHMQGALASTGNRLDVALNGRGFFQITGPDGETLYTRAGAFNTNATGQLVTIDGLEVQPGLTIPTEATDIVINEQGQVFARLAGVPTPQSLGQLTLSTFANDAGLQPMGNNLFRETAASGAPVAGTPGQTGFGTVRQGYLEGSNVDSVREITELIAAQRAYEMNSKVMQAADEMASMIAKSVR